MPHDSFAFDSRNVAVDIIRLLERVAVPRRVSLRALAFAVIS